MRPDRINRYFPLIAAGLALIGGCGNPQPKPNILGGGRPKQVEDTVLYIAQGVMAGEITGHSVILHARHPSGYEEFSTGALVDANSRAGRLAGDPNSTDPGSLIHQYFVQGPGQVSGGFLNIRQSTGQGVTKLIFTFYDEHGKVHYSVTREIN